MPDKKQTIFIAVSQGFSSRYFLRTDILQTLQRSGARVVILTPNADEEYFRREFEKGDVLVEKLRTEEYKRYGRKRSYKFIQYIRSFVVNGKMDSRQLDLRYEGEKRTRPRSSLMARVYYEIIDQLISLLRISRHLRHLFIVVDGFLHTPSVHKDLFLKYKPHKIILASLGYMDHDHLLAREAKKFGVKVVSVILSWDNITTKGFPGFYPDRLLAWTDVMKEELVQYLDVDPGRITVSGVAHFDYHVRRENIWTREKFFSHFGLDPDRNLLLFAPRSPNKFPWNPDIVALLAKALNDGRLFRPCQLLVRLHPLNFRTSNGLFRFEKDTEQHLEVRKRYPFVFYDFPHVLSNKLPMDLSSDDMIKIASLLYHCDLMISYYSTLMLEACLHNKPVINVCLFSHNEHLGKYNVQAHLIPRIKRIRETGGIRDAFTETDLVSIINWYLENPRRDEEGRKIIVSKECGPHLGFAGESIGREILDL